LRRYELLTTVPRQNLLQCHYQEMFLPIALENWHPIPTVHHRHHQKVFHIFKLETSSLLFANCHSLTLQQCCSTKTFLSPLLAFPFFGLKPSVFHHQMLFGASLKTLTALLWTFSSLCPASLLSTQLLSWLVQSQA